MPLLRLHTDLIYRCVFVTAATLLLAADPVLGKPAVSFPPGLVVNVVTDHGAKADGVSDDTAALQAALNAGIGRVVFLPEGTYRVTDRLEWPKGSHFPPMVLFGASRDGVVIRLDDEAPGFGDAANPRAVIWTQKLGSADNFRNVIRHLTVDVGRGNPGAVGIQFMSNNMGGVVDVALRNPDGSAAIGLDLAYNPLNGPLLVQDLHVEGFMIGVAAGHTINSQVLDGITLVGQSQAGLRNHGQVLTVYGLRTQNRVPAVVQSHPSAFMVLADAELDGGDSGEPAIKNAGFMVLRDVERQGYASLLSDDAGQTVVEGEAVEAMATHPLQHATFDPAGLRLPVVEAPEVPWDNNPSDWAMVTDFGAVSGDKADDSEAIQAAIDSGATTIGFPTGQYVLSKPVFVRGPARRFFGFESSIKLGVDGPAIRLADTPDAAPIVLFEHFNFDPHAAHGPLDNGDERTLVVKHTKGIGGVFSGGGDLFMADIGSGVRRPLVFQGGGDVWIRQLSNEPRRDQTHLVNHGSTVWVLGQKTEMPGVLAQTDRGGRTEILGGFAYSGIGGDSDGYPMYRVDDASFSAVIGGVHYARKRRPYAVLLEIVGIDETQTVSVSAAPPRENFIVVPGVTVRRAAQSNN